MRVVSPARCCRGVHSLQCPGIFAATAVAVVAAAPPARLGGCYAIRPEANCFAHTIFLGVDWGRTRYITEGAGVKKAFLSYMAVIR